MIRKMRQVQYGEVTAVVQDGRIVLIRVAMTIKPGNGAPKAE